jgi:hypothetical protein
MGKTIIQFFSTLKKMKARQPDHTKFIVFGNYVFGDEMRHLSTPFPVLG